MNTLIKPISFLNKKNPKSNVKISQLKTPNLKIPPFKTPKINVKVPPFKTPNLKILPYTIIFPYLIYPQNAYAYDIDFTLFVKDATSQDLLMYVAYNFIMWQFPMIVIGRLLNLSWNYISIQLVIIGIIRFILIHNQ
jgi:hypothetical protein